LPKLDMKASQWDAPTNVVVTNVNRNSRMWSQ